MRQMSSGLWLANQLRYSRAPVGATKVSFLPLQKTGVFLPLCKALRPAASLTIVGNEVMRLTPLAYILGLICCAACCAASGCRLLGNAVRTLVVEPIHYCACSDAKFSHHRHQRMAEETWADFAQANPSLSYSPDYGLGFRDGFTDFLDAGPGNVPLLPPRHYWKSRFQTPAGHQAIVDWYDGFSHGAQVAADTGYRQYVTLPSSFARGGAPVHHHEFPVGHMSAESIPTPLPDTVNDDALRNDAPPLSIPEDPPQRSTH